MLRYFTSLIFVISLAFNVLGQNTDSSKVIFKKNIISKDSSIVSSKYVKDSTQKFSSISPKIRIGLDVSRLFLSATRKDFKGFETSLDINFDRHIFEFHAGFAEHSQKLETYSPISSGPYLSVGYGKNVFSENDNILSLGGRLAGSSFNFQARDVKIIDPYSKEKTFLDLEEKNSTVIWAEFVTAIKAKVFGWVMMGFELRLKGRLHARSDGFQPYSVPGYGFYSGKTSVGFNYFLLINIPTKK
jgi:hypothetical protein